MCRTTTTIATLVICAAAPLAAADDRPTLQAQGLWDHAGHSGAIRQVGEWCDTCEGAGSRTLFRWSDDPFSAPLEDDVIVTDRPDFTEASSTVGAGVIQVEAGYTYVYDSESGTSTRLQSWGEPLFRIGLHEDWLEFRLAVLPLEERVTSPGTSNTTNGVEDIFVGFKIGLTPQAGLLPEMAIIPRILVPSGSSSFGRDGVRPGLNWIYGWEINDWLSTAGSTQFNRAIDGGTNEPYLFVAQSWTVAIALTEAWGIYAEWFALGRSGADTAQVQQFVNGGFTYLVNDDVQLDIRAGRGLNSAADDFFVGTGISMRFR